MKTNRSAPDAPSNHLSRPKNHRDLLQSARHDVLRDLGVQFGSVSGSDRVADDDLALVNHDQFVNGRLNKLDYDRLRLINEAIDRFDAGDTVRASAARSLSHHGAWKSSPGQNTASNARRGSPAGKQKRPRTNYCPNLSGRFKSVGQDSLTRCVPHSLRQQLLNQSTLHIGQPEIAALEAVSQLRVVEAEQVQNRRVHIVDIDLLFAG